MSMLPFYLHYQISALARLLPPFSAPVRVSPPAALRAHAPSASRWRRLAQRPRALALSSP